MQKKSELRKLKSFELEIKTIPITGACGINVKQGIFSFFTVNGSIRIKIRENGPYNIITHIDDLKDIFPEENFTMS